MQKNGKLFKVGLLSLLALLVMCTGTYAQDGFQTLSTPTLYNWMESSDKPVLVYSLNPIEFNEQHISGSICIPAELMEGNPNMPRDKNRRIVFYCHGPG